MRTDNPIGARRHVRTWIDHERALYADTKYAEDTIGRERLIADTATHPRMNGPDGGTWITFITNYLGRARQFGMDTPQGRQALGKLIVTLMHCLETAVMVHGPMPEAGHPSGEVVAQ